MYRQIVSLLSDSAPSSTQYNKEALKLFKKHPLDLALVLEQVWKRRWTMEFELGHPLNRSELEQIRSEILPTDPHFNQIIKREIFGWHHLIYAYMIENTRIYEIFRKVIYEFIHGEKLGVPLKNTGCEHWLRTTEELFFKDPAPFLITSVSSHIRSDLGATRRNAYYRMFGMDLNHGMDDKKEYPYLKPKASNREFVNTFENLLREVWIGITNVTTTNTNPTDDAAIANLTERLHNMLITRRETGNLSREEFYAVSTLSWFHLALEFDSPIVLACDGEAASPEERLFKIAERVNLPAHGESRSFFEIAESMSILLTLIETGSLNSTSSARVLYDSSLSSLPDLMRTMITHWSILTGREMKTRKTQVSV